MAEIHGSHTRIYANGLNISTLFREVECGRERELVDTTAFASTDTEHIIAPASSAMLSASGMIEVDPDTGVQVVKDMLDAAENNTAGDDIIVTMLRDTTIGDPGFGLLGSTQQIRHSFPHTEVAKTSLQAQSNKALWVSSLHPLAARTTAYNSVGLDNGAATTFGGLGFLTVTALSGTTPVLTAKLQHSSDSTNGTNGTWVDLGTFATINAASVAAGYADHELVTGTINDWVRISVAVTSGSLSSVTFAAQFGRYNTNK